jgi:cytochrome c oxidase subunit I+III
VTASPPGNHNFDEIPLVGSLSPLWEEGDHGLDPETVRELGVLDRPWRLRRELVRTTTIDAEPEAIVVIPGPTYWPLVTAVALAAGVIGILVDSWGLAAAGGLAFLGCVVGWLTEDRIQLTRQSSDPSGASPAALASVGTENDPGIEVGGADEQPAADRRQAARHLAETRTGGRSAAWWAVMTGMTAVGTVVGALAYSYYYLRLGVDEWPPPGSAAPGLGFPLVAAGLVVAALGVGLLGKRRTAWRAGAWVVGAAGLAAQVAGVAGSGLRVAANSFEAMTLVLQGAGLALLGTAVLVRLVALVVGARVAHDAEPVEVDTGFWNVSLSLWLGVWVVVHLSPGVI